MFTVKHVGTDGVESIVSVDSASFNKELNTLIGVGPNAMQFASWSSGLAYVMNEQGKTVAVYNLTMRTDTVKVSDEQAKQARTTAQKVWTK